VLRALLFACIKGETMATSQSSSVVEAFGRLFWMFAGPAVLFSLAYTILKKDDDWFGSASIAFLIVLFGVIVARRRDPNNGFGDPTTPAEARAFTVGALLVGLVAWVIAHLV
jgi:hypothetical protein